MNPGQSLLSLARQQYPPQSYGLKLKDWVGCGEVRTASTTAEPVRCSDLVLAVLAVLAVLEKSHALTRQSLLKVVFP